MRIRITPDQLRERANEFRDDARLMSEFLEKTDVLLTQLRNEWPDLYYYPNGRTSGYQRFMAQMCGEKVVDDVKIRIDTDVEFAKFAELRPSLVKAEEQAKKIALALEQMAEDVFDS